MITINREAINDSSIQDLVYFIRGQSNTGRSGIGGQPAHIVQNVPIARSYIWNITLGQWDALTLGVNGGCPSDTTTGDDDYGIAHELAYQEGLKHPSKTIRIVLGAYGGAAMGFINDAPEWKPDFRFSTNYPFKNIYQENIGYETAALATLSSYIEMCEVWYQGERDSGPDEASSLYAVNERVYYDRIVKDTGIRRKRFSFKINTNATNNGIYIGVVNANKQINYDLGLCDYLRDTSDLAVQGDLVHNTAAGTTTISNYISDNI